jgi:hypothetical protein
VLKKVSVLLFQVWRWKRAYRVPQYVRKSDNPTVSKTNHMLVTDQGGIKIILKCGGYLGRHTTSDSTNGNGIKRTLLGEDLSDELETLSVNCLAKKQ